MRYEDDNYVDETKDTPNHIMWKILNNKLHFVRDTQFGWWNINLDKGVLPKYMLGAFTTLDLAKKQARVYVHNKHQQILDENYKNIKDVA